jgi:phage shock protein PspC (stress-responsive transcriptional regulator)
MSEHTTHIPETRRLERSRSDRMVAGVSGGLARYFEIHPAVFRVGFVVLALLGGAGILIYAAAALVIPDEGKDDSIATAALRERRDRPWPLIGLGLLAVAGAILLSRATLWPDGDSWWLFLIAGAVILWVTRHPASGPSAQPTDLTEPAPTEPTDPAGPIGPVGPATEAKALAKEDSRRLRRVFRGLAIAVASLLALALIAVAIFAAVFDVHPGRGIGDRHFVVTSPQELRDEYRLGLGSLELDLSRMQFPPGVTYLDARVDVGDLQVILPPGVALRGYGEARAGHVNLLGAEDDGWNADVDLGGDGARVLDLTARVGAGSVRVERAVR